MTIDMKSLAEMGARARLDELQAETVALLRAFPTLRTGKNDAGRTRPSQVAAPATTARRTRKPMTAAARRAVSARMKKYWAARRKATSPKK